MSTAETFDGAEMPSGIGMTLGEFVHRMRWGSDDQRRFCAEVTEHVLFELAFAGFEYPRAVMDVVQAALHDEQALVRAAAALALREFGEDAVEAIPDLVDLLQSDVDEDVRAAAASTIPCIDRTSAWIPTFVKMLRDPSPTIRLGAAVALERSNLSDCDVEPALRAVLNDSECSVRISACWAIWSKTGRADGLIDVLIDCIRSDENRRLDAARLLCWMKDKAAPALPVLLALKDDEAWHMRLQAIRATTMLACSSEMARPVLEQLRDDESEIVRSYVRSALEKFSDFTDEKT